LHSQAGAQKAAHSSYSSERNVVLVKTTQTETEAENAACKGCLCADCIIKQMHKKLHGQVTPLKGMLCWSKETETESCLCADCILKQMHKKLLCSRRNGRHFMSVEAKQ